MLVVHSIYVLHHQKSYGSQEILVSLNIRKKSFSFLTYLDKKNAVDGQAIGQKVSYPKDDCIFLM